MKLGAGLTLRVAVTVFDPLNLAVIVTDACVVTERDVIVKVVEVAFAGTITLVRTVAAEGLLSASATSIPPTRRESVEGYGAGRDDTAARDGRRVQGQRCEAGGRPPIPAMISSGVSEESSSIDLLKIASVNPEPQATDGPQPAPLSFTS